MTHDLEHAEALNGLDARKKSILILIVKLLIESGLLRRAFEYIRELLTREEEEEEEETEE